MSSKLVFSIISVQEGPLQIPKDIIPFQYNIKNYLSAGYHHSCLCVDSCIGMTMGIDTEVGDKIKVAFFTFLLQ